MNAFDIARAGWLGDLTQWIKDLVIAVWHAFTAFMLDLVEVWFDMVVTMWMTVIDALPPVDFLNGITLCGILSGAGPTVAWAVGAMHLPAGLGVIAGGFVFYFARKLLTLGQW